MQIKTTWTFHLSPVRMVSRKKKEWLVAILRTVKQFELEINFLIEFLLQYMQGEKTTQTQLWKKSFDI